jgi:hypothetical protein
MFVYKFLPSKYALDAIISGKIKLSTVNELNDAFEFRGVRYMQAEKGHQEPNDYARNLEFLIDLVREQHALLCLSKEHTNPTMWSHYADCHKGIVLGFEISDSLKLSGHDIEYKPNIVEINEPFETVINDDELALKFLKVKSMGWRYENEIRFFFSKKDCIPKPIEGDLRFFINMEDEGFILKEIILGINCPISASEIKCLLGGRKGIDLFVASIDNNCFKVRKAFP